MLQDKRIFGKAEVDADGNISRTEVQYTAKVMQASLSVAAGNGEVLAMPERPKVEPSLLLPTSYFLLPTSYFLLAMPERPKVEPYLLLLTSYFLLPTSYFLPPTSYLLLPTSYLLPPTSYLLPPTS